MIPVRCRVSVHAARTGLLLILAYLFWLDRALHRRIFAYLHVNYLSGEQIDLVGYNLALGWLVCFCISVACVFALLAV